MKKMLCYPVLPEEYYYASLEQQSAYYSTKEAAYENIDICQDKFVAISINVFAWVVFDKDNYVAPEVLARDSKKEIKFKETLKGSTAQEALDYLVARIWLDMWEK